MQDKLDQTEETKMNILCDRLMLITDYSSNPRLLKRITTSLDADTLEELLEAIDTMLLAQRVDAYEQGYDNALHSFSRI